MSTQRLPVPGSDDGNWGDILNGFLEVAHNSDGTLQSSALTTAGAATVGQIPSNASSIGGLLTTNNLSELSATASIARVNIGAQAVGNYVTRAGGSSVVIAVNPCFNVMDFGALGNGSTNDATAIQNAITAAGSGIVYFPAGTYILGTSLQITTPCTLRGAGRDATTLQLANGVNDYAIKFAQTTNTPLTAVYFSDFQINGNSLNQTAGGGISAVYAVQCSFDRLHMTACYDWGVYLQGAANSSFGHHNRFISCLFDGATSAAGGYGGGICATSCDENFYYGCDFENLGGTANMAQGLPACILDSCGEQQITSCCFVGSRSSNTPIFGVCVNSASNTRIIGCTFDGVPGDNVFISGSDCNVIGCNMSDIGNGNPNAGTASGVHLGYGAFRNSVIGNNLASNNTDGQTRSFIREEQIGNMGKNVMANNTCNVNGTAAQANIEPNGIASIIRGNINYNPVGHVTAPSVPITNTPLTNPINVDASVFITGGTVTAVAIGGASTGLTTGQFFLPAGQTITLTYSAAPTWSWFGN